MKKNVVVFFVLFVAIFGVVKTAGAMEDIRLRIGEKEYYKGHVLIEMDENVPPSIEDGGYIFVPLRFAVVDLFEVGGVVWCGVSRTATITTDKLVVTLTLGESFAEVNGETKELSVSTWLNDAGIFFVPLCFLCDIFNLAMDYDSAQGEIHVYVPPPVALFRIENHEVAMGETVIYIDESYDPGGGTIIERHWSGKRMAFFEPAEYEVSLQVKNHRGKLSDPYTQKVIVSDEELMDELTYHLTYPFPREKLLVDLLSGAKDLPRLEASTAINERTLLFSNNPETVKQEGILYNDRVQGEVRLFYHHLIENDGLYLYLLALNSGDNEISMVEEQWGAAGPWHQAAEVGRLAIKRYLEFDCSDKAYLAPGEFRIINSGWLDKSPAKAGVVGGIYDLFFKQEVEIYFVAALPDSTLDEMLNLPVLDREGNHNRGTFSQVNRKLDLEVFDSGFLRLADGHNDLWVKGVDALMGDADTIDNRGNYGVKYELEIKHPLYTAIFIQGRSDEPISTVAKVKEEAVLLPEYGTAAENEMVLVSFEHSEESTITFIPTGGMALPVHFIFYIMENWEAPVQYRLRIEQEGEGATLPASGDHYYAENEETFLEAMPSDGWEFVKWIINGIKFATPNNKISMDTDKTATAYFALKQYTIIFNSYEGSEVASQEINHGSTAAKPTEPIRSGYSFDGWYTDVAFTNPYNFNTPVTASITLYAKWKPIFADSKSITSFIMADLTPEIAGDINEEDKTITLMLPQGTDITALVPVIMHTGLSISPASGEAIDFTEPVIYTVTAEDESTQEYTVKILFAEQEDECFIATAAFGSKYDPAVALLRQFRDAKLLDNIPGQAFVKFYNNISPTIARYIAANNILKGLVRVVLLPVVALAYLLMHSWLLFIIIMGYFVVYWWRKYCLKITSGT